MLIVKRHNNILQYMESTYINISDPHSLMYKLHLCCYPFVFRPFYRVVNAVFGKIGRIASNKIIVQLMKTKCFCSSALRPYGLEACSHTYANRNLLT